ncbi:MAG: hypothetical protein J6N51_08085 [Selenomonas sp.]|nr:hypothetical protein [Selenomonas sp.]
MGTISTDKVIAIGVLAAFIISMIMGTDKELQTFLAGGLLGYLQRNSGGSTPAGTVPPKAGDRK